MTEVAMGVLRTLFILIFVFLPSRFTFSYLPMLIFCSADIRLLQIRELQISDGSSILTCSLKGG